MSCAPWPLSAPRVLLWQWLTSHGKQWSCSAARATATVKGETCLQGGWENSGTRLQMLLVLLREQSCGTPEELLHPHSSSAQGHFVLSERAFGGTGRSDGSSPYRDGQMRLRGGREKLAMPITATVLQNKTKCSTDCRGSRSLRQKGLCMALVPLLTGSTASHHDTQTGREETSNIPSLLFSM